MRCIMAFAVIAAGIQATAASAADDCAGFRKVYEARLSGFGEFQLHFDASEDAYRSSIDLPGARSCWVDGSRGKYHCRWTYRNTSREEITKNYRRLTEIADACVPPDEVRTISNAYVGGNSMVGRHRIYLKRRDDVREMIDVTASFWEDRSSGWVQLIIGHDL